MDRYGALLGVALLVVGAVQVAFSLTQDPFTWRLFYVLFGTSLAAVGVGTVWSAREIADD